MAGPSLEVDENLLQYATPRQREILEAVILHGSAGKAAISLGVDRTYPIKVHAAVQKRAASKGYSPAHDFVRPVPDGFVAKGVSTYYNREGKPTGQWVKASIDQERQREIMQATIEAMCLEIKPVPPVASPSASLDQLCTLYTFTDYHVGMLAWDKEGGDNWDVQIAESTGIAAMQALVGQSPASGWGIVNIQGDFMHYDGMAAITPTHGHPLDGDSRFGKMVDVSIRIIRQLVGLALQKHERVTLLICEGNHDIASSLWLRKLFACLYESEARIDVHDSELPYYAIQHGQTMLGFHHGHLHKNDKLPELFAAQFRSMWGQCPKVYIHTGHRHHKEDKEHSGARVIQHPTLAARDAYAARGGWYAERAITAVTYHAKYGEAGTVTVTPEMLAA